MGCSHLEAGGVYISEDLGILSDIIGMAAWVEQMPEPYPALGSAQGQGISLPRCRTHKNDAGLFTTKYIYSRCFLSYKANSDLSRMSTNE